MQQIEDLLDSGGYVTVHIDKNAPRAMHKELRKAFAQTEEVAFVEPVRAGWGDWSLVEATLRLLRLSIEQFPDATHFYFLSGDCVPIRPAVDLHQYLKTQGQDIIEAVDFFEGNWIKTGPKIERIMFYHFFNERLQKTLFYLSYDIQRLLGINRPVPEGLKMAIGSQWWCLRRTTVAKILLFLLHRKDVVKFFKRCWIPDEIFFQTLVNSLVPAEKIDNRPPTFLRFSDYGMPTVFYDDHFHFLVAQREFFARKISPHARLLRNRLRAVFKDEEHAEPGESSGRNTIDFTVYAGRIGARFGSRIWDLYSTVDPDDEIYVIVSKKWHVGKRVGYALSEVTKIPFFGYLFDDGGENLGDLGGYQQTAVQAREQPGAYLKIALECHHSNAAIIGIDSTNFGILKKLSERVENLYIIEVENEFSADYLDGHAERAGLMSTRGKSVQRDALHRTILETFRVDSRRLKTVQAREYESIRIWHSEQQRSEIFAKVFKKPAKSFADMVKTVDIKD